MGTETIKLENTGTQADWFEMSDGTHDHVTFALNQGNPTGGDIGIIRIQDTKPLPQEQDGLRLTDSIVGNRSGTSAYNTCVTISDADTKVWVRIASGRSLVVVRGDAVIVQH